MNPTNQILENWELDEKPEVLLIDNHLVYNFLTQAKEKINWILSEFSGVEYSPSKDIILKEFYTHNRFILGFSKVFKLRKIEHLSLINDFIFDFARQNNTLALHSMNYLARIGLESMLKIISEITESKKTTVDLLPIVEESKVYLKKIYDNYIKKKEIHPTPERKEVRTDLELSEMPDERMSDYQKSKQEMEQELATEAEEMNPIDSLEELAEEINIPPNKVGLISDFYEEAYQNLSSMGKDLIDLENAPDSLDIVNTLFRSMHTIKGGARLLQIQKMEKLAHKLESLLDQIRNQKLEANSEIIDILLEGKNLLTEILEEIASKGPIRTKINPILDRLDIVTQGKKLPSKKVEVVQKKSSEIEIPITLNKDQSIKDTIDKKPSPKDPKKEQEHIVKIKNRQNESIRVSTEKLDEVINTASELSVTRIHFQDEISSIHRLIRDIKKLLQRIEDSDFASMLGRVSQANEQVMFELEEYFSSIGVKYEKEVLEIIIKRFYNELKSEASRSELTISEEMTLLLIAATELKNITLKNVENLEILTTRLQSGVMNFRMVPLASLFERFPTLVRDVARQIGKKVKLEIYGADTELDRTIINQLSDPLLHILRNSIDHGIESMEERIQKGKKEIGTIQLKSYYQGSNAVIEIKDDGKGINKQAVINKALEKGIVNEEELAHMTDKQIYEFIFAPGFSTASSVTELSGRGVGMDVVVNSIKELQGFVDIDSEPGKGTTISLKIPLTLAVVRVLLFETGSRFLALPMSNISEIMRISRSEIESISNRMIFNLKGEIIHLVHLSKVLEMNTTSFIPEEIPLLILAEGTRKIGLIVDALHGRQEIVIKNMGNILKKVPFIMGCAILSDRKLVLVLNPRDVVDACFEEHNHLHALEFQNSPKKIHNILVVDDSLVHRQNVRMILTRAGYNVDEAENGFEALKMVRIKKYTILCVDVVMPLMDGIELTRRLRNLPLYRTIPILLITSKQSREDRERGIKSGANEYFEKPIDSDVLLAAIDRYIKDRETEVKSE
jgi:two-component system, chemotaxis family, sensor kinase CheA